MSPAETAAAFAKLAQGRVVNGRAAVPNSLGNCFKTRSALSANLLERRRQIGMGRIDKVAEQVQVAPLELRGYFDAGDDLDSDRARALQRMKLLQCCEVIGASDRDITRSFRRPRFGFDAEPAVQFVENLRSGYQCLHK